MESLELRIAKFKLSIHIEERDGVPSIVLQYNDALYSRRLMEDFALSMATALQHMTEYPDQPVRKVSLLDPDRRKQVEKLPDGRSRSCLHRALSSGTGTAGKAEARTYRTDSL